MKWFEHCKIAVSLTQELFTRPDKTSCWWCKSSSIIQELKFYNNKNLSSSPEIIDFQVFWHSETCSLAAYMTEEEVLKGMIYPSISRYRTWVFLLLTVGWIYF